MNEMPHNLNSKKSKSPPLRVRLKSNFIAVVFCSIASFVALGISSFFYNIGYNEYMLLLPVLYIAAFIIFGFLWAFRICPVKKSNNLKLVDLKNRPSDYKIRCFIRSGVYLAFPIVICFLSYLDSTKVTVLRLEIYISPLIPYLTINYDKERRALHDIISGISVKYSDDKKNLEDNNPNKDRVAVIEYIVGLIILNILFIWPMIPF